MKKVLVLTDMQFSGSGYFNIAVPLFTELSKNYKVIIVGLGYEGQEHNHPFSIIPCKDTNDAHAIVHNLNMISQTVPDVIIVALDIPQQIFFYEKFAQYKKPYIAITPLENPPLTMSWTAPMFNMDWIFFISELGKQSALKAGLKKVDHIQIGIDSKFWRVPTQEERQGLRKGMGIEDDEFVILTIADNQERKNLWATLATTCMLKYQINYDELMKVFMGEKRISDFQETGKKVRHILVTRVDTPFGHKIRDLAMIMGINKELMTMNRGMPNDNLWSLYALSDCFLLTSKAEGLGLPVMEAMSCGCPVVATDTGAIRELLENDRGFLVPPMLNFIDVWGNENRSMIDIKEAADSVEFVFTGSRTEIYSPTAYESVNTATSLSRKLMESKTWDVPAKQLSDKIEELTNVKE